MCYVYVYIKKLHVTLFQSTQLVNHVLDYRTNHTVVLIIYRVSKLEVSRIKIFVICSFLRRVVCLLVYTACGMVTKFSKLTIGQYNSRCVYLDSINGSCLTKINLLIPLQVIVFWHCLMV